MADFPPGNYQGKFPQNVLPLGAAATRSLRLGLRLVALARHLRLLEVAAAHGGAVARKGGRAHKAASAWTPRVMFARAWMTNPR